MPPDPLAIACFACWLCFAQHTSQALSWKLVTKISRAAYVKQFGCEALLQPFFDHVNQMGKVIPQLN